MTQLLKTVPGAAPFTSRGQERTSAREEASCSFLRPFLLCRLGKKAQVHLVRLLRLSVCTGRDSREIEERDTTQETMRNRAVPK